MSGKKVIGIILLFLGVIGLFISLFANLIDIGPIGQSPGFGLQQTIGTIIGVAFIVFGLLFTVKS
jgi:hypothetical protein